MPGVLDGAQPRPELAPVQGVEPQPEMAVAWWQFGLIAVVLAAIVLIVVALRRR